MSKVRVVTVFAVSAALLIGGLGINASAAEKRKIQFTKVARQTLSETKYAVGEIPDHEFVAQHFLDTMKPTGDSHWDVVQERVFNNDRTVGGKGTHRGYSIDIFRSGD